MAIERQHGGVSSKMYAVMCGIECAFRIRHDARGEKNKKIILVSPKEKLKVYTGDAIIKKSKSKKAHTRNKMTGKEHTRAILKEKKLHDWLKFFEKANTKKDDLADSFLQGLSVIQHEI